MRLRRGISQEQGWPGVGTQHMVIPFYAQPCPLLLNTEHSCGHSLNRIIWLLDTWMLFLENRRRKPKKRKRKAKEKASHSQGVNLDSSVAGA